MKPVLHAFSKICARLKVHLIVDAVLLSTQRLGISAALSRIHGSLTSREWRSCRVKERRNKWTDMLDPVLWCPAFDFSRCVAHASRSYYHRQYSQYCMFSPHDSRCIDPSRSFPISFTPPQVDDQRSVVSPPRCSEPRASPGEVRSLRGGIFLTVVLCRSLVYN